MSLQIDKNACYYHNDPKRLESVVALYRLCGRPGYENSLFSHGTEYGPVKSLVETIIAERKKADLSPEFIDIYIDQKYINHENNNLPENGNHIEFTLDIKGIRNQIFYENVEGLIQKTSGFSDCKLPADFYIADMNYYSGDPEIPEPIQTIHRLLDAISHLSDLAPYCEKKVSQQAMRLVFILPRKDSDLDTIVLETEITHSILNAAKDLDFALLEEVNTGSAQSDPHYFTKKSIFATCLARFIQAIPPEGSAFEYLIKNWDWFVDSYRKDIGTYFSGFGFHKAKREVAEAELKLADEFSQILGNISGKLFSIPVSTAALFAMFKAEGVLQNTIVILGVFIASLVMTGMVNNQKTQFRRVKHAKDLVLSSLEGKQSGYPEDLQKAVQKMKEDLEKGEKKLGFQLNLYLALGWLPLLLAVGIAGVIKFK